MAETFFGSCPVHRITRADEAYPARFRELTGRPAAIDGRGRLPGSGPTAAIVGSRNCTAYGRWQAEVFARALAAGGVAVISGMAAGIDAAAQRAALEAGGESYAVLGCGADVCYPASSRSLYETLLRRGGVISEYENGTQPLPYHFPARNRLISGLADAVLVIEAAARSGSLITADMALEQGRSVFALPGRIGDIRSEGCLKLIAEGAYVALSPESVLRELKRIHPGGFPPVSRAPKEPAETILPQTGDEAETLPISGAAARLYRAVTHEPVLLEVLAEAAGLSPAEAAGAAWELKDRSLIREVYDQQYVRKK